MGRDETIDVADVYAGMSFLVHFSMRHTNDKMLETDVSGPPLDIHNEMERKLRM